MLSVSLTDFAGNRVFRGFRALLMAAIPYFWPGTWRHPEKRHLTTTLRRVGLLT
jgi:hypothetical protein